MGENLCILFFQVFKGANEYFDLYWMDCFAVSHKA